MPASRFELFVDAAPGLGELLTISNVWDLAQRRDHDGNDHRYDLVVLDGPASGQTVGIERSLKDQGAVGVLARSWSR